MLPLSETQRGVWTYCQQHPSSNCYHIAFCVICPNDINAERLWHSVVQTVNRHPILKVKIGKTAEGEPMMVRRDTDKPRVVIERTTEEHIETIEQSFTQNLDIDNGELYRIAIIQTEQKVRLLAVFHHIVFDGLSAGIFLDEISAFYLDKLLPEEQIDAFDIIKREQTLRQSADYERARCWYEETFKKSFGRLLPLRDIHRGGEDAIAFHKQPLSFGIKQLQSLSVATGVSPNILTLTAFAFLQGCYTGESRARFATVFHGRHGYQTKNTVGMFVHSLPITLEWEAELPLREVMQTLRRQLQRAMAYDLYPFTEVVQECGGFGDISFVYQGNTPRSDTFCGYSMQRKMLMPALTGTKLGIELWIEGNILELHIEYDANCYSLDIIRNIAYTYNAILSSLTKAKTASEVRFIDEGMNTDIEAFNPKATPFRSSSTIPILFNDIVSRYPHQTAVIASDATLSYLQLKQQCEHWVERMRLKGIGKRCVVGIHVERSSLMAIAPLAVLMTGAAYLPLPFNQPASVVEKMLDNAEAEWLFTADGLQPLHSVTRKPKRPSSLFALFYTSGSTGRPKAVCLSHQNLLAYCDWYQSYFHPTLGTRIGAYNHFAFDGSLTDIFPTLLSGATLCIVPDPIRQDIPLLEDYINEHHIEIIDLPTQIGRMFATQATCPSLRHIVLGGEAMMPISQSVAYQLHNQYGPTETTVAVSVYPITGEEAVVPIGKPLSHSKLYVVGPYGQRLPIGAIGELWVAGTQVALGYWHNKRLTTEVFTENPFEKGDFHRVYHTGDYVRLLTNGNLEYIGRRDRMVKIRGYRVELAEVERAIATIKDIKQVAATVIQHPTDGLSLVVYVTASHPINKQQIIDWLRTNEPSYFIPADIIQLDQLPLSPQGKTDFSRLPLPSWQSTNHYVPPQGPLENLICDIFAHVLEREKVSADANFFLIGGSSIKAMHVVARMEAAGHRIRYADIYSHPTAQHLAKLIENPSVQPIIENITIQEESVSPAEVSNIGNVLLTGATGFLGIHVLYELLHNGTQVTCLVQPSENQSGYQRLMDNLHFYFGTSIDSHIHNNLHVIEGDLLSAALPMDATSLTVINCAAIVKHFAPNDELKHANIDGALHMARFCMNHGHRLVHVSTLTRGASNPYNNSKLKAEQRLLELTKDGLALTIVRMGNLSPRYADGALPKDFERNTTLAWMRTVSLLECVPEEALSQMVDFTPVDFAARALLLLCGATGTNVFHLFNPHLLTVNDIVTLIGKTGKKVEKVTSAEFDFRVSQLILQPDSASKLVAALSHYRNLPTTIDSKVFESNSKTEQWLCHQQFTWPSTLSDYILHFLSQIV